MKSQTARALDRLRTVPAPRRPPLDRSHPRTNLHNRLELIAGPATPPYAAQADADLARGRRALRHRRAVRRVGASIFAVAAWSPLRPQAVAAAHLVAYHGEQPKRITIDKVPDGWEVKGVSAAALTIAPIDAEDKEPDSLVGKIAVMLRSQDDPSTPTGTKVTVAGRPVVINTGQGADHGQNLWVKQPNGIWMLVQMGRPWLEPGEHGGVPHRHPRPEGRRTGRG